MIFCHKCFKNHKENGWYLSSQDKEIADVTQCAVHPTLTNNRLVRTLKTLRTWSLEHDGFIHKNCPGLHLVICGGRISRRTAEAILFDYEKPFLDLLIQEGYLTAENNVDGVVQVLQVNGTADDFIRAYMDSKVEKAA